MNYALSAYGWPIYMKSNVICGCCKLLKNVRYQFMCRMAMILIYPPYFKNPKIETMSPLNVGKLNPIYRSRNTFKQLAVVSSVLQNFSLCRRCWRSLGTTQQSVPKEGASQRTERQHLPKISIKILYHPPYNKSFHSSFTCNMVVVLQLVAKMLHTVMLDLNPTPPLPPFYRSWQECNIILETWTNNFEGGRRRGCVISHIFLTMQ